MISLFGLHAVIIVKILLDASIQYSIAFFEKKKINKIL